jgi:hypothetical protein
VFKTWTKTRFGLSPKKLAGFCRSASCRNWRQRRPPALAASSGGQQRSPAAVASSSGQQRRDGCQQMAATGWRRPPCHIAALVKPNAQDSIAAQYSQRTHIRQPRKGRQQLRGMTRTPFPSTAIVALFVGKGSQWRSWSYEASLGPSVPPMRRSCCYTSSSLSARTNLHHCTMRALMLVRHCVAQSLNWFSHCLARLVPWRAIS